MVGPLETFMKNMMSEDISVRLVVDNARICPHETRKQRRNRPTTHGSSSAFSVLMHEEAMEGRKSTRPMNTTSSRSRDQSLDVSDHNKRETRWDSTHMSPKQCDQISPPSRRLITTTSFDAPLICP